MVLEVFNTTSIDYGKFTSEEFKALSAHDKKNEALLSFESEIICNLRNEDFINSNVRFLFLLISYIMFSFPSDKT